MANVALAPLTSSDDQLPRAHLLVNGSDTNRIVDGVFLEASFQTPVGLLLFVTDDVPYEDMLHIHLLNSDFVLLDTLCIGGPNTTGTFRDLEQVDKHTYLFRFMGKHRMRLELSALPHFMMPMFSIGRSLNLCRLRGQMSIFREE